MYLTQSLHRRSQVMPDAPMTICKDRTTTNAEGVDLVARYAGGLQRLGVTSDDRVGLLDVNTDFFAFGAFAIAWADGILVPVNHRWSVKEVAYSLIEADVEVLIVGDPFLDLVEPLEAACSDLTTIVHAGVAPTPDGVVPLSVLLETEPVPDAHRGGDQLLGLFYTGGTTGLPKGVMLSHRGVMLSAIGSAAAGSFPRGGKAAQIAPAFHLAGFASLVMAGVQDQTAVMIPEFVPTDVMRIIQDSEVQQTLLVPTMIQMICDHPDVGQFDLSSLEMLIYGASPISTALLDRASKTFPSARFCQAYGMTELSPTTTILTPSDHQLAEKRRSAGRPVPYALVKVVDPDGNEVPRGTVGEIVAKGDHVMRGYWKKPNETDEALRDGWMHTGDGGFMDDDGYVFVVDRIKDMIISGGENVYSVEVENVVAKHPSVVQVAVIGLPDEKWGERVHAVVELAAGASLTIEDLREFARQEIAAYKCPQTMEVITAWPLSGAGKILKRELRAQRSEREPVA